MPTISLVKYFVPAVTAVVAIPVGYPTDEAVKAETLFLVLGRSIPEGGTVYVLQRCGRGRLDDGWRESRGRVENGKRRVGRLGGKGIGSYDKSDYRFSRYK